MWEANNGCHSVRNIETSQPINLIAMNIHRASVFENLKQTNKQTNKGPAWAKVHAYRLSAAGLVTLLQSGFTGASLPSQAPRITFGKSSRRQRRQPNQQLPPSPYLSSRSTSPHLRNSDTSPNLHPKPANSNAAMASKGVSSLKFVGTVSLGLLTVSLVPWQSRANGGQRAPE